MMQVTEMCNRHSVAYCHCIYTETFRSTLLLLLITSRSYQHVVNLEDRVGLLTVTNAKDSSHQLFYLIRLPAVRTQAYSVVIREVSVIIIIIIIIIITDKTAYN